MIIYRKKKKKEVKYLAYRNSASPTAFLCIFNALAWVSFTLQTLIALMQWLSTFFSLQGCIPLGQVLLHPAKSLQTSGASQRSHSPLCCFSPSPCSGAWQFFSNPHIVCVKPHIKFAPHKPFHWAATGIPLLGHSSVYMVWKHFWNKES